MCCAVRGCHPALFVDDPTGGGQDDERRLNQRRQQLFEQFEESVVGPVKIAQGQHQRAPGHGRAEQQRQPGAEFVSPASGVWTLGVVITEGVHDRSRRHVDVGRVGGGPDEFANDRPHPLGRGLL